MSPAIKADGTLRIEWRCPDCWLAFIKAAKGLPLSSRPETARAKPKSGTRAVAPSAPDEDDDPTPVGPSRGRRRSSIPPPRRGRRR